jgi:hypothetical protein
MSKFNSYAKKLNEQAKAAFEEYRKAEAAYKKAEEQAKAYPQRNGFVDAQYAAKSARAQADYIEAKQAYETARRVFRNSDTQFNGMRKELAAAIEDAYSADPAQLDSNALELTKSGIMSASEYAKLLEQAKAANNPTMVRMIGKYAGEAAKAREESHGQNDNEVQALRVVGHNSRSYTGGDRLEAFDNMVSLYHRCTNNPAMIDHWDEFTAETVENF